METEDTQHDQWFVYDEYRFTQRETPRTMELVVTTTNYQDALQRLREGTNRYPKVVFHNNGSVKEHGWRRVIMADPNFEYTELRRRLGLPTEPNNN